MAGKIMVLVDECWYAEFKRVADTLCVLDQIDAINEHQYRATKKNPRPISAMRPEVEE